MSAEDNATQQEEAQVEEVYTFGIFKDTIQGGAKYAPKFRAYVDVPSSGYEDIDPTSYTATGKILERYLEIAQPQDPYGVWWVGKYPDAPDYAYSYWSLDRIKVECNVQVYRF